MTATDRLIPADGTTRRLRALATLGWPNTDLGDRLGVTRVQISWWRTGRYRDVHQSTADRIAAVYDELRETPGPSSRTRVHARRAGWATPHQWRGRDIDDPAAQPRTPRRRLPLSQGKADVA